MTQTAQEPMQVKLDRLNYFQALSQERKQGHPEYWTVQNMIDQLVRTLENVYEVDPVLNPLTGTWEI